MPPETSYKQETTTFSFYFLLHLQPLVMTINFFFIQNLHICLYFHRPSGFTMNRQEMTSHWSTIWWIIRSTWVSDTNWIQLLTVSSFGAASNYKNTCAGCFCSNLEAAEGDNLFNYLTCLMLTKSHFIYSRLMTGSLFKSLSYFLF